MRGTTTSRVVDHARESARQQVQIRALEAAVALEQRRREQMEVKYARLKRKYVRLERAFATLQERVRRKREREHDGIFMLVLTRLARTKHAFDHRRRRVRDPRPVPSHQPHRRGKTLKMTR